MIRDMDAIAKAHQATMVSAQRMLSAYGEAPLPSLLAQLYMANAVEGPDGHKRTMVGRHDVTPALEAMEKGPMRQANALARAFRASPRRRDWMKSVEAGAALAKATLDVGTLTNLSQVTGGQALGYVSLDTAMARSTIRPGSFTLYQMLKKTRANQVVDYWPTAAEIGGALPGAAFNSYASVNSGALATSAGVYDMNSITLKLSLDGRAITAALAAQNSFVDVAQQENTNASLVVLSSIDWALYWGNPAIFPNQPMGLQQTLLASAPAKNIVDFQQWSQYNPNGNSNQQLLFNLIFEQVAEMVSYRHFGIPTHAVMGPGTAGDLQQLPTTILQQIVNLNNRNGDHGPMVVNADIQGMNTRFGDVHFPVDLMMTARDIPAAAITYANGTTPATTTGPTKPVSVTPTAVTNQTGSDWTAAYCASSGVYTYAVASTDTLMNESTLTYSASVSGVAVNGGYSIVIAPPAAADAYAFRVYRSGLGYSAGASSVPTAFRHIGDILANGSSNVTFVDLNTKIPGSETIFILDLDEQDDAFDYRWLLPLSRIELFAQNLYMPWAVAHIGAPRVRIPQFHGMITNYVPQKTDFNPLKANN